jgi:hypothetical protein
MASKVVIRAEALAALLRSPDGPLGRHIITLAERVQELAKEQVGVSDNNEGGHLRDTIVKRVVQEGAGIAVYVGSSHPIALIHHEGTRPHQILPNKASVLAFEVGGQVVFATVVNHPGTAPNRFLTDPLRTVMASISGSAAA